MNGIRSVPLRKMGRLSAIIKSPERWTAETPCLYKLHLTLQNGKGKVVEQIEHTVGFRSVEIKKGQLLVNGNPVRFRGVNRHEHDPRTARVMSEERMLQDILFNEAGKYKCCAHQSLPECKPLVRAMRQLWDCT